ncbi:MAG TPA: hypothetical protein VME43_25515 [Bryobacteraceae bacterium]|nr:hypothetical protein [Bryobacteraceae bacterium]
MAENICMGQEPQRRFAGWLYRGAMHRQARELLARLGIAADPAWRLRDLNFAGQQSVEIARALARQADRRRRFYPRFSAGRPSPAQRLARIPVSFFAD